MHCIHCGGNENLFEVKVVDIAKSLVEYETHTACKKCLQEREIWCEYHGVPTMYGDSSGGNYFHLDGDKFQSVCLQCTADFEKITSREDIRDMANVACMCLSDETRIFLSSGLPEPFEKNDSDFFLMVNLATFMVLSEREFLQVVTDHMPGVDDILRNN